MPIRLFVPQYWPTWLGLGLLRLLVVLPFPWLVRLGRALGALINAHSPGPPRFRRDPQGVAISPGSCVIRSSKPGSLVALRRVPSAFQTNRYVRSDTNGASVLSSTRANKGRTLICLLLRQAPRR